MFVPDLGKHVDELIYIYKKCRPNVREEMAETVIKNLVDADYFRTIKSKLNSRILDLLKDPRASFYIIDGMQYNKFFINVASRDNLVDIRW